MTDKVPLRDTSPLPAPTSCTSILTGLQATAQYRMIANIAQPLPYTSSPFLLALQDIYLFIRITFVWPLTSGIPSIILPFFPYHSGTLDELYPSYNNIKAILLHLFLIFAQGAFLLQLLPSFFFGVPVPLLAFTPTCFITLVGVVVTNDYFCTLLNGTKRRFTSISDASWPDTSDEKWVFINGVAVGSHWMQSNLDLLALTFRRPIHGIHNKTRGIIFDVIETIIQRTFGYATPDVREIYADVQQFVQDEINGAQRYRKIVLVLHSQGAVEGGLVLDWLYATVDRDLLGRVEVYTFGSAANHFCNPPGCFGVDGGEKRRVVKHVEHYANMQDYVALFGILNFRPLPTMKGRGMRTGSKRNGDGNGTGASATAREIVERTYVGRLFVRKGSGHQLNGNYLDNFFAMDQESKLVDEDNEYMNSELNEEVFEGYDIASRASEKDVWDYQGGDGKGNDKKIKEVSRLWSYRNGGSPKD